MAQRKCASDTLLEISAIFGSYGHSAVATAITKMVWDERKKKRVFTPFEDRLHNILYSVKETVAAHFPPPSVPGVTESTVMTVKQ